jgi:hypothetical protein
MLGQPCFFFKKNLAVALRRLVSFFIATVRTHTHTQNTIQKNYTCTPFLFLFNQREHVPDNDVSISSLKDDIELLRLRTPPGGGGVGGSPYRPP